MGCYCFISLAILALALFLNFYELIPSLPEDDDSYTISTPIPFSKRPYHFVTDQATNLQRTSWNGSATIVDAVLEQYPILFQAPFVSEWEALNWDLWALSRKWPVLFDTLVSKQSLFLFYEVLYVSTV